MYSGRQAWGHTGSYCLCVSSNYLANKYYKVRAQHNKDHTVLFNGEPTEVSGIWCIMHD